MIEDGFYWVKIKGEQIWRIAELEDADWWLIGSDTRWDGDNLEVGPKINPPA